MHPVTPSVAVSYGFPMWIRLTHFFNIIFITLLMRSGIEILSAHPKLYWNDHCQPGSEWLKFTRRQMPRDELWTASDEEEPFSPWVALPGRANLGLGRHWHFFTVTGWVLTGLVYVVLLLAAPHWRRLIPTSGAIFPQAWQAARIYASFHLPPAGKPLPAARYLVFRTFDDKWEVPGHGYFYGTIDLELAHHSQTILADEMNGQPLPIPHGAPLRLRVETQLGFTMVRYLRAIEFVEGYQTVGEGQGGWREDVLHFFRMQAYKWRFSSLFRK